VIPATVTIEAGEVSMVRLAVAQKEVVDVYQMRTLTWFLTVLCPATTKGRKTGSKKGEISPYLITERRVPALIPILGSQLAGDVSHKPGGRLPLLSTRPAVTSATLKRAAASFAAW